MPTQWNPAVCVLYTCHVAGNLNQLSTKQNTWALSVVSSGSQWDFVFLLIATWETKTMVNLRITWHIADYGRQAYKNGPSCHHHQTSLQDYHRRQQLNHWRNTRDQEWSFPLVPSSSLLHFCLSAISEPLPSPWPKLKTRSQICKAWVRAWRITFWDPHQATPGSSWWPTPICWGP